MLHSCWDSPESGLLTRYGSVTRVRQERHKTSPLDCLRNRTLAHRSAPTFTTPHNTPVSIGQLCQKIEILVIDVQRMRSHAVGQDRILFRRLWFCFGPAGTTFLSKLRHGKFSFSGVRSIEQRLEQRYFRPAQDPSIVGDLFSICKPPCGGETVEKNFATVWSEGGFEQSETTIIATREQRKIVATGIVS